MPRAKPLSPDDRRKAIIDVTIPLVRENGMDVTTRHIADAAGIAEGTIFRAFATKDELLRAAVSAALDPAAAVEQLQLIDPTADLHEKVLAATVIMHDHMRNIIELATTIGRHFLRNADHHPHRDLHEGAHAALDAIFQTHRDELRISPDQAAKVLEMLTFSNSHPRLNRGHSLPPRVIADLLLNGLRRPESAIVSPEARVSPDSPAARTTRRSNR